MTIKILSNNTINKISAGEVIERPASVVKELVENSIDSGATKIDILLEQSGKNLIIVSDNGGGMNREDLELAIQRHATSKLDENDLLNINSFGFRGEALPSIGAISKFKIISKKHGSESAYSLVINGGIQEETIQSSLNEGTTIEVRDLFFATPARLKFLRSDKTELMAIIALVRKIALSHPIISFNLTHEGKELLKIKGDALFDETYSQRISCIMGNEFIENAAYVNYTNYDINISGYTSIPTYNRASADEQFLFINGRPVKDKILNIAMKVAYQDFLPRDRHAVSALFLKLDPHLVDVNVHPAKTEVRFHDPNLVRTIVIRAIKEALKTNGQRVSSTLGTDAISYMLTETSKTTSLREDYDHNSLSTPKTDYFKEKHTINNLTQPLTQIDRAHTSLFEEVPTIKPPEQQTIQPSHYKLGAAVAQLHKTYIISQTEDSVIITDQHAAHERLGYERIKEQLSKNGIVRQRLLIPEIVELSTTEKAEIIFENKNSLSELGLEVQKFGENSIIVSEVPSLLGEINIIQLINDLADYLLDLGENIALTELIEHVTETYACHYAIRAGRSLSVYEMNALLRQMEETDFSAQCNHGRPTYIKLQLKDIEKLFGRR